MPSGLPALRRPYMLAAEKRKHMRAKTKTAKQRLAILELAESLGNVSEACRQGDMTRTQFYKFKQRYLAQGEGGLQNLPPIPQSHPMATPPALAKQVVALALTHPSYGCGKLESLLAADGKRLSDVTIQKILQEHQLGNRRDRWLALEKQTTIPGFHASDMQLAFIEKANPCFRERNTQAKRPGEQLCQDTFLVGPFRGVDKVYVHSVVDTFSCYAFCFIHISKQPEVAIALLQHDVLPFYKRHKLSVSSIMTNGGREFHGEAMHPYDHFLRTNGIVHQISRTKRPLVNGFVERFRQTVLDEFCRPTRREKIFNTMEALQNDLDKWLRHYNGERTHLGYPNNGLSPGVMVQEFISVKTKTSS